MRLSFFLVQQLARILVPELSLSSTGLLVLRSLERGSACGACGLEPCRMASVAIKLGFPPSALATPGSPLTPQAGQSFLAECLVLPRLLSQHPSRPARPARYRGLGPAFSSRVPPRTSWLDCRWRCLRHSLDWNLKRGVARTKLRGSGRSPFAGPGLNSLESCLPSGIKHHPVIDRQHAVHVMHGLRQHLLNSHQP